MSAVSLILCLFIPALSTAIVFPGSSDIFRSQKVVPLIYTEYGPIQGTQEKAPEGYLEIDQWLGIPYAAPPTGALRFDRPSPPKRWRGVLPAYRFKPSCPQPRYSSLSQSMIEERLRINQSQVPMSDDCLYLNIWRPHFWTSWSDLAYIPVMILINGENFMQGSAMSPEENGGTLTWETDIIVVTVSYRTGPLGFFNGSNIALYDIKAAIEWVYHNIERFAGNSSKITLAASGTGSALASYLAYNQRHWPVRMIHRLLLLDGRAMLAPGTLISRQEAHQRAKVVAWVCYCLLEENGTDTEIYRDVHWPSSSINMTCIREQPLDTWAAPDILWAGMDGRLYHLRLPWAPVIDGDIIREDVLHFKDSFGLTGIDVMMGGSSTAGVDSLIDGHHFKREGPNLQTDWDFFEGINRANRDIGECVYPAVAYRYTDWRWPKDPEMRRDQLTDMVTDRYYRCPMANLFNHYLSHDRQSAHNAYFFQLEYPTHTHFPDWMTGPAANSVLVWAMGIPLRDSSYTKQERDFAKILMNFVGNFVMLGTPNHWEKSWMPINWPEATFDDKKYLVMDVNRFSVHTDLRPDHCAFWTNFVPILLHQMHEIYNLGDLQIRESIQQSNGDPITFEPGKQPPSCKPAYKYF